MLFPIMVLKNSLVMIFSHMVTWPTVAKGLLKCNPGQMSCTLGLFVISLFLITLLPLPHPSLALPSPSPSLPPPHPSSPFLFPPPLLPPFVILSWMDAYCLEVGVGKPPPLSRIQLTFMEVLTQSRCTYFPCTMFWSPGYALIKSIEWFPFYFLIQIVEQIDQADIQLVVELFFSDAESGWVAVMLFKS